MTTITFPVVKVHFKISHILLLFLLKRGLAESSEEKDAGVSRKRA